MKKLGNIRLATPEEVEQIRSKIDLTAATSVYAFENGEQVPDFAVVRQATELDPVLFGEGISNTRKYLFLWFLENHMRDLGIQEFYFNLRADDEDWQDIVKEWGAVQVSEAPELRFKVSLRK